MFRCFVQIKMFTGKVSYELNSGVTKTIFFFKKHVYRINFVWVDLKVHENNIFMLLRDIVMDILIQFLVFGKSLIFISNLTLLRMFGVRFKPNTENLGNLSKTFYKVAIKKGLIKFRSFHFQNLKFIIYPERKLFLLYNIICQIGFFMIFYTFSNKPLRVD